METVSGSRVEGTKPSEAAGGEPSSRVPEAAGEGAGAEPAPAPGPGKLRKTALKLFGGKRGICTLPSLFGGGRSRGPGKGAARKGQSRTHDGLGQVAGGSDPPGEARPPPGSQSAQGALGPGPAPGGPEAAGGERLPPPQRPRRGLKGLLSSIRLHKKSRAAAPGTPREAQAGPSGSATPPTSGGSDASGDRGPGKSEPAAAAEGTGPAGPGGPSPARAAEADPAGPAAADREEGPGAGEPAPGPSGDQLSLLFGDVTSLKSFDSLTGCGDVTAEQDEDSLAESTVSGERGPGREAAKRSSCLVTYQGGGEEMASPDGMEEAERPAEGGGRPAWESPAPARGESPPGDRCPQPRSPPPPGDLLSPQSDQPESAPNSDEGYYDSMTPGPEEEPGPARRDRLPRDSYSGDALYEFFDPEEEDLGASPAGDEGLFEAFGDFGPWPLGKGTARAVVETEEERLAALQRQLLYWELRQDGLRGRGEQEPGGPPGPGWSAPTPGRGGREALGQGRGAVGTERGPEGPGETEAELAVSFSQALVAFGGGGGGGGTLFSSLSGSSASDSSFTQNLPALPAMVTFDIVDVEREGEGECEDAHEHLAASLETFDACFSPPKEVGLGSVGRPGWALASGPFGGFPWGVGSLPRHLGLPGLSPPPPPAPTALGRRSRSLDTESLDLELAGRHPAGGCSGAGEGGDGLFFGPRAPGWPCSLPRSRPAAPPRAGVDAPPSRGRPPGGPLARSEPRAPGYAVRPCDLPLAGPAKPGQEAQRTRAERGTRAPGQQRGPGGCLPKSLGAGQGHRTMEA
ncbi:APC membrane recruitment protein 1 [Tachyglossus aculeatus]|uniref:APC membrane recruitment protein 1 n=1 Tax=Tachyglossus aculeatus TaxID=9261 RepID=UPI0018F75BAF|nr:APC membrane recruitment protein 1 [Tachyglossus aculeatus]